MGHLLGLIKAAGPRKLLFFSGYALYLVVGYMVIHSGTVISSAGEMNLDTQTMFGLVGMATHTVMYLLIACSVFFIRQVSVTIPVAVAGITATMGFLVMGMLFQFSELLPADLTLPWLLLAGLLLAVGDVFLILLWARLFATLELRALYFYVLLSNALSLIIYFFVTLLPTQTSVPIALVLFLLSVFFISRALKLREEQQWEFSAPVFRHAVRNISQPLIGTAVLFFMSGLMQQISRQRELPLWEFQQISLLTSAVVVLCLLLPALLLKRQPTVSRIYALAVPLSAAGFLLLPLIWNAAGGIVNSFAQLGSMVAMIVLWCALSDMSRDTKLSPMLLFSLALACTQLALFSGTLIGFLNAGTLQYGDVVLTAVALVSAYLLFMAAIFLFRGKSSNGLDGEDHHEPVHHDDLLPGRCKELAESHKLTSREAEIFVWLAQGYTIPVISGKLFVSENTVKSHVKSIYQKLEVHSRSHLIEMVAHRD